MIMQLKSLFAEKKRTDAYGLWQGDTNWAWLQDWSGGAPRAAARHGPHLNLNQTTATVAGSLFGFG